MATMRSGVALVAGALALALGGAPGAAAQAPASGPPAIPYPVTLRYGTGLIDIPVAWVSPTNGDLFLGLSGTEIASSFNSNLTLETHWKHLFTVGFSLYSNNPDWGFSGQVLALN